MAHHRPAVLELTTDALQLPAEVIIEVLQYVSRNKDLGACCTVSRTWHRAARFVLYRTLILKLDGMWRAKYKDSSLQHLTSTLEKNPDLFKLTRRITIDARKVEHWSNLKDDEELKKASQSIRMIVRRAQRTIAINVIGGIARDDTRHIEGLFSSDRENLSFKDFPFIVGWEDVYDLLESSRSLRRLTFSSGLEDGPGIRFTPFRIHLSAFDPTEYGSSYTLTPSAAEQWGMELSAARSVNLYRLQRWTDLGHGHGLRIRANLVRLEVSTSPHPYSQPAPSKEAQEKGGEEEDEDSEEDEEESRAIETFELVGREKDPLRSQEEIGRILQSSRPLPLNVFSLDFASTYVQPSFILRLLQGGTLPHLRHLVLPSKTFYGAPPEEPFYQRPGSSPLRQAGVDSLTWEWEQYDLHRVLFREQWSQEADDTVEYCEMHDIEVEWAHQQDNVPRVFNEWAEAQARKGKAGG